MTDRKGEISEAVIESLRSGENRELSDWRQLWKADREFPIVSHRGWLGKLMVAGKRLMRGVVKAPQADLWERQRAYNLVVQDRIEAAEELGRRLGEVERELAGSISRVSRVGEGVNRLGRDLQQVQGELVADIDELSSDVTREVSALGSSFRELMGFLESHAKRLDHLEGFHNRGYAEVMDHTTALFSQLDSKLDRYRELSRGRWSRLGGLLAVAEGGVAEAGSTAPKLEIVPKTQPKTEMTMKPATAQALADEKYLEFEDRFRGREEDIARRLEPYLEILSGRGEVFDLGCGRGEALAVMSAHGITCSGVDSNVEMVNRCREKGFDAEVGDLFSALEGRSEASLGGLVSFHVIEHLPAADLERLTRLAWRVLSPGGVLVLETPNPMSVVVGASRFWIDPTHKRPVHPESLKTMLELSGFDPVERIDLQPFEDQDRLPEISTDGLEPDLLPLVQRINLLRDRLDDLLFGFQDYALVAYKPK